MHLAPVLHRVTADEVLARLEHAGHVLSVLPLAGCFPAGLRTVWPEIRSIPRKRAIPSPADITAMDEAYQWTEHIPDPDERRLVLMRSMMVTSDRTGRAYHYWTWGKLRRLTGRHPDTLQQLHGRGIARVVKALNAPPSISRRPDDPYLWRR